MLGSMGAGAAHGIRASSNVPPSGPAPRVQDDLYESLELDSVPAWLGFTTGSSPAAGSARFLFTLVVSSQGISATAAKALSPAAVTRPRDRRTGGGLVSVSVVVVPVAVMITPWRGNRPDWAIYLTIAGTIPGRHEGERTA